MPRDEEIRRLSRRLGRTTTHVVRILGSYLRHWAITYLHTYRFLVRQLVCLQLGSVDWGISLDYVNGINTQSVPMQHDQREIMSLTGSPACAVPDSDNKSRYRK